MLLLASRCLLVLMVTGRQVLVWSGRPERPTVFVVDTVRIRRQLPTHLREQVNILYLAVPYQDRRSKGPVPLQSLSMLPSVTPLEVRFRRQPFIDIGQELHSNNSKETRLFDVICRPATLTAKN